MSRPPRLASDAPARNRADTTVTRKKVASHSKRIEATFAFIDLAGFTALTEVQGDFDAADMATRFADLTRSALGEGDRLVKTLGDAVLVTSPSPAAGRALGEGDRLVKTLGDAVLVTSPSPAAALDLVERILMAAAAEKSLPALRAGLHHGPAIERDEDVFGAAVNLAARVAAEAYAGEVLATAAVAAAANERGIPVVEIGAVALKNVSEPTVLSSLGFMLGAIESAIDPVCQAIVDRRSAVGQLCYERKFYWFCSLTCAAAFASNPRWHVGHAGK